MGLDDVLARCIERWRKLGVALAPPVDDGEIRSTWDGLGGQASDDVVRLYSTLGGFAEYESDFGFFWSFWPWAMIREENQCRRSKGIMFCDHSIRVLTWELRFEDKYHSSIWEAETGLMTAPSIESFLRLYLEHPWRLLTRWEPQPGSTLSKSRKFTGGRPIANRSDPLWDEVLDG
jgi:hypothetical protein